MIISSIRTIFLGEVDIPNGQRNAISAARRKAFHALAPLAAIYSLLNAVVLTFAFWNHAAMPLVILWCYTSAVLIFLRLRDGRRPEPLNEGRAADGRIVRYTVLSGAVWGAIIAALIASSGPEHALLLGLFTAATLCVGALLHSSFPLASLGYSLFIGGSACVGMAIGGHAWSINAILLIVVTVTALQRFAAANHATEVSRQLANAAAQEATEAMTVLLHDFEAHSADWLWRIDADGRLINPSQRFVAATGLPPQVLDEGRLLALFSSESATALDRLLRQREPFRDEVFLAVIGEKDAWWSLSGQPTSDGGWRGVCSDVTRSRNAEARIAYVTEYDSLTDLPNRAMLVRQLEVVQADLEAGSDGHALFVLDLDNFKSINDTLGHPAGDTYLKVVAERLRDCVGPDAFLARLGGDEFAVLKRDVLSDEAGEIADHIVDALLAPVRLNGKEILSGGSVGVALAPEHGEDPAELMKNAELALYRAKAQGRGCARFFEAGMEEDARVRADLETDLRAALANEAMDVYFQPLVDTRTHRISGYETLLRWNRPGYGLISPALFITCAEETGIIVPLGEWVIRKAIEEASQWKDDVTVAINLSPAQMKNPSLVATVVSSLATSQLDPSRLEIEIVESVLMDETEHNIRTLHALRELGVKISLDDFGTGYSSLSYLRAFPFDKIKIDQRFVRDIDSAPENRAIVKAVISLARDLGMRVTAEGVENEQQAMILASLGCTEVQGFLYSRPIPPSEVEKKPGADQRTGSLRVLRRQA